MNAIISFLLLASLSCMVSADNANMIALPKTCEDVLPADRCVQLRNIADAIKAKTSEVNEAVKQAVANGANNAQDIYNKAVDFFRSRVLTLQCENVLSLQKCDRLRNITSLLHVKSAEVNEAIRSAVIRGAAAGKEAYAKAIDFFQNKLTKLTCADVLSSDRCARLESLRAVVKGKVTDVQTAIVEAVLAGRRSVEEVYAKAVDFFQNKLTKLSCVDMLPAERCSRLSVIAINLQGKMSEAEERIRTTILSGKTKATELFNSAVELFKTNVANKKCEDLLPADQCANLSSLAAGMKLKAAEFNTYVINALSTGVQTAVTKFEEVKEYLKTQVTCEAVMSAKSCAAARSLATRLKVSVAEVDRIIRETVVKGISTISELYKTVLNYLYSKILGSTSVDRSRRSVLIDLYKDLKSKIAAKIQNAKALLTQATKECLDAFKIADAGVRAIIETAILEGKARLSTLKASVKDMLDQLVGGTTTTVSTTAAVTKFKRDIRDDLRNALTKVKGLMKPLIERLLAKSNAALLRVRSYIEDILKKINGGMTTRDADNDYNDLLLMADEQVKIDLQTLADNAETQAEAVIRDTVEASEREIDTITASFEHDVQKRDLLDTLIRIKIDAALHILGLALGGNAGVAQKLLDDNRAEIEAAMKKGFLALIRVIPRLLG